MKKKQVIKIVADILMTIILLLLMSYLMIGIGLHEWLGAGMFVFFDFGESIVKFFVDYLAIFALFVCIGHYVAKLARSQNKNLKQKRRTKLWQKI